MKTCKGCKWAEWKKTAAGRLHPKGSGKCVFPATVPVMPFSVGGSYAGRNALRAIEACIHSHRTVYRNEELRDHCPCYAPEGT